MRRFDRILEQELHVAEAPAAPEAPPKPAPKKLPKSPPPDRSPDKSPSPFKPPQPKFAPEPKNMLSMFDMLSEAYEDEVHPGTQKYFQGLRGNDKEFLSKNPIMSLYGDMLSREGWQDIRSRLEMKDINPQTVMRTMMQILQIERQHSNELVELAKDVTVKVWGIPREMLDGKLITQQGGNGVSQDDIHAARSFENDDVEMTKELLAHINKRITSNIMAHGSAIHAMMSLHHLVDKEIEAIDPRLLQLYNKISAGSFGSYWMIDIPRMLGMLASQRAGSAKVEYDDQQQPTVVARAITFPVLAQEFNKGVAELISHYGLADLDTDTTEKVVKHADDIRHEPYISIIGPALWKRFLKVKPKDIPLAQLMMAFHKQQPQEVQKIMMAVIDEPELATRLLTDLVTMPERFDLESELEDFGSDQSFDSDDSEWNDDNV